MISPSQRPLPATTRNMHIHTPGGIPTRNPQQAIGHRPMPQTARPPGRHNGHQGAKISCATKTLDSSPALDLPSTLCIAADRQFLVLSNMAALFGTIEKCNEQFSSTNAFTYGHTHTHEDYAVYLRSMTWGKHTKRST